MKTTVTPLAPRAAAVFFLIALCVAGLAAHDRKAAGALSLVVGWATEPAFAGAMNGVVVAVSDKSGPLTKIDGALSVDVTFGNERITLPLEPGVQRPHELHAALVPTRAGTYAFHVTGRINNQPIDITSTCGEGTFHCVAEATAIQFPVKDPSVGELAARMDRALPRSDEATGTAERATYIAGLAFGVSIVAFTVALIVAVRSRKSA